MPSRKLIVPVIKLIAHRIVVLDQILMGWSRGMLTSLGNRMMKRELISVMAITNPT